jgi:hypothetical protein
MVVMRLFVLMLAAAAMAGPVAAKSACGAKTYLRYGETRAKFGEVLGACRPDGFCSVVSTLPAPPKLAVYSAQLRVARPKHGAPYTLEFTGVVPMPRADGRTMSVTIGRRTTDLSGPYTPTMSGANVLGVLEQETADDLIRQMSGARALTWRYEGETGPATKRFGLRGFSKALRWIDCMGRR